MDKNKSILGMLEDYYVFIKHEAKTGGDLYDGFKNYRKLVLDNWPLDMPDNGNWQSEMENVYEKLRLKKEVSVISRSSDLRSFRNDAVECVHAINGKFNYHLNKE